LLMYEYHAIPPYQYSYEYQVMVAPARDACTRSKAGASAESRLTDQHNSFTFYLSATSPSELLHSLRMQAS
jgi:hypothetical protein